MNYWKLVVLGFALVSLQAVAAIVGETKGKVITIRTSSHYHESIPTDAETETIFKLSNSYVDCEWVGIKNSEAAFVSTLLASQAQSKEVSVWYYKDKYSPVWGNVCQAITIELK
ncbi:hypothetical protein [Gallaecimonas xiamenensis]|uniref:hypothetical protein n=1 Tax=Gallaecimonas xiamenensis TaxID=1207039 RepID=UPI0012EA633D|nr:hypothetical protein [Gallaecimonas xiamenensis]